MAAAAKVVEGFAKTSEAVAFHSATALLESTKEGSAYLAFDNARKALAAVQNGTEFAAFQTAQKALSIVQTGTEFTEWKTAEKTLQAAQTTGCAFLHTAELALNPGTSATYLALDTAKKGLDGVKNGTAAFAYGQAKTYLEGAKLGADGVLKLSSYIAAHSGKLIDVQHGDLSARLKDIENGQLFTANISIAVLCTPNNWSLNFNVKNVASFILALFEKSYLMAEAVAKGIV